MDYWEFRKYSFEKANPKPMLRTCFVLLWLNHIIFQKHQEEIKLKDKQIESQKEENNTLRSKLEKSKNIIKELIN